MPKHIAESKAKDLVTEIEAAYTYDGRSGLRLVSARERGHRPWLFIRRVKRLKDSMPEVEVVVMGDYLTEPMRARPERQTSFSVLDLTPRQAVDLIRALASVLVKDLKVLEYVALADYPDRVPSWHCQRKRRKHQNKS